MPSIGILAYGSLIADPGREIINAAALDASGGIVTVPFETPFEVEYARLSRTRGGAPTLVCVPEGVSSSVCGTIIVLSASIALKDAKNILYRRELDCVGDPSYQYDDKKQRKEKNAVVIDEISTHPDFNILVYASLRPTPELLVIIQDSNLSTQAKAHHLAGAASDSINAYTFFRCRDGVRYLAEAIRCGIYTSLTESYRQEILVMAGNAPDLEEARVRLARAKGLISA